MTNTVHLFYTGVLSEPNQDILDSGQMIFKTAYFYKWQKKNKIPDIVLIAAITEIQDGLLDADLGGFVLKKRVPKSNSGKSDGYRTIIEVEHEKK